MSKDPARNPMDLTGKSILIVKPSSMGDVVHTLPVVHAIKRCHPSCHIGWIIQRNFLGIIESDPAVDEIIPIRIPSTSDPNAPRGVFLAAAKATLLTIRELRKRFRNNPYDVVLDLHASFRSGLLSWVNPNGMRMGFSDAKELNCYFQDRLVGIDPVKPHAVDKNLQFLAHLACSPLPEDFRVVTSTESRNSVEEFLKSEGVDDHTRIVYANPCTRWESKHWTIAGWSQLADMLEDQEGLTVCFAGSPADLPYISRITAAMRGKPVIAAGKLNLAQSMALIEAARVYVGVDSGPMHVAAFTDTPVVALFGPTAPELVGPYGTRHRIIRNPDADCLACRKRHCDDHECMKGIEPEVVFEEVCRVVNNDSPTRKHDEPTL